MPKRRLTAQLLEERRGVAHVLRRLSMGPQTGLIAGLRDTDAAIARALDLSHQEPELYPYTPPATYDDDRVANIVGPLTWWIDTMVTSPRLIEERLVWFWHDHFATGLQKVRAPYLMWQQHLTIRQHATGSFADLLHAISKDPAMLVYLDGVTNTARAVNENFGREVMELFTLGRGNYTEADVVEASRAFTGWAVNVPGRPGLGGARLGVSVPAWSAAFVPARADRANKTILGTTAAFDLDGALDRLLDEPATAQRISAKLFRELVGRIPGEPTLRRLAKRFRKDWKIPALVEAIVAEPAFLADAAIGAKVRSPLEKLVGMLQAVPATTVQAGSSGRRLRPGAPAGLTDALRALGYFPFAPPNVGGFPEGTSLLGPSQLVHTFDLLSIYPTLPELPRRADALFTKFGLFGVSDRTRATVEKERDPATRFALVLGSPEYAVT